MRFVAILGVTLIALLSASPAARPQWAEGESHADQFVTYLQSDAFISPGFGFRSVHIGMPFAAVETAWGSPKRRSAGITRRWYYEPEPGSVIRVQGIRTVSQIAVSGTPGSIFQTEQGVRFGNTPRRVQQVYGAARLQKNALRYPALGIDFGFRDGELVEIAVEAPD